MIKRGMVALSAMLLMTFAAGTLTHTVLAQAPNATAGCGGNILTLKPWYASIVDANCEIKPFPADEKEQTAYIWSIVLVIVEDIFQLAAYAALGFVMYGGFLYLTSTGSPDATKKALQTIINAVIGLVVAMASVAIVGYIAGSIK